MRLQDWERAMFVDFEVVRDEGGKLFPVEIGIAGMSGKWISKWIAPRSDWAPGPRASTEELAKFEQAKSGVAVEEVVEWIEQAFPGRLLISDAVIVDLPLLRRIMEGRQHSFNLKEFFVVIEDLRKMAQVDMPTFNRWIVEIDDNRKEVHRAGEDAWVRAELARRLLIAANQK